MKKYLLLFAVASVLVACGGGSSGGSAPVVVVDPPPPPPMSMVDPMTADLATRTMQAPDDQEPVAEGAVMLSTTDGDEPVPLM